MHRRSNSVRYSEGVFCFAGTSDVNLLADTLASLPQHLDLFIANNQHSLLLFFNLPFFPLFKSRPYQKCLHFSSSMTLSPPIHYY